MRGYKDLQVWQKSIELCDLVFMATKTLPRSELYGLSSQMRRAAVSIPSNIAEGSRRSTKNDFKQFVHIAFGSASELETQLIIAKRTSLLAEDEVQKIDPCLQSVLRLLNAFLIYLSRSK